MRRQETFVARLLREGRKPESITVARTSTTPPRALRHPAGAGEQLTFHVFALVDDDGWPEGATFTFVESVSRDAADPDI